MYNSPAKGVLSTPYYPGPYSPPGMLTCHRGVLPDIWKAPRIPNRYKDLQTLHLPFPLPSVCSPPSGAQMPAVVGVGAAGGTHSMLSPTRWIPVPACNQGLSWMRSPTSLPPPLPHSKDCFPELQPFPTQRPSPLRNPPDDWALRRSLPQECLTSHMDSKGSPDQCLAWLQQPWASFI